MMTFALYIKDGWEQIVLTPETECLSAMGRVKNRKVGSDIRGWREGVVDFGQFARSGARHFKCLAEPRIVLAQKFLKRAAF